MKAVILAAGLGSRLRPITNEVPKCMVPVNDIRIIDKQIDNLQQVGIKDILVVAGYKGSILQKHLQDTYPFVTIINNARYDETNNMYSLYLCQSFIGNNDFFLMNADVYYDSNIIKGMYEDLHESLIACDCRKFMEESMKITIDNGNRINHISKKISENEHYAVSIDVYKIGKSAQQALFTKIKKIIEVIKNENSWTEVALDEILGDVIFTPYVINGRWFEIDNLDDLQQAEILFSGDVLCQH